MTSPTRSWATAVPYGTYESGGGHRLGQRGHRSRHAAFALESIRRWWHGQGQDAYARAGRTTDHRRRRRLQRLPRPGLRMRPDELPPLFSPGPRQSQSGQRADRSLLRRPPVEDFVGEAPPRASSGPGGKLTVRSGRAHAEAGRRLRTALAGPHTPPRADPAVEAGQLDIQAASAGTASPEFRAPTRRTRHWTESIDRRAARRGRGRVD
ncbi:MULTISPECIES: hypothetical protein [unclassified Streptomyces]|uniref:ISAzo13-like element transposase-related protein n=1 Tax=unclassified Streptomyces TaxID=2593676 RepID=UPI00338F1884